MLIIVSGIVFWIVFWRAQYEITIGLLDELWNKNLVNLFVTPLKFSEWITAWLIMGILKGLMSFAFAALLAFLFYQTNIFVYGFAMIPFLFILLLSGWWVGFLVASIIMRYGSKVQTLAWSVPWIAAPFSAIYYPVSILPHWAQLIASVIPTSYVFEGMRELMSTGAFDTNKFFIALFLNLIYLTLSLVLIKNSFSKIMEKGVIKLF
jgi:ABC-2 type transport system permease protein